MRKCSKESAPYPSFLMNVSATRPFSYSVIIIKFINFLIATSFQSLWFPFSLKSEPPAARWLSSSPGVLTVISFVMKASMIVSLPSIHLALIASMRITAALLGRPLTTLLRSPRSKRAYLKNGQTSRRSPVLVYTSVPVKIRSPDRPSRLFLFGTKIIHTHHTTIAFLFLCRFSVVASR